MEILKNNSLKEKIQSIGGISSFGTMASENSTDYLSLTGGTLTGATNNTVCFGIPKNGTAGYGLCNSDGTSIIRDHGNQNVTIDSTGAGLYLGYQNTTSVNFFNENLVLNNSGFNLYTKGVLSVIGNASGIYTPLRIIGNNPNNESSILYSNAGVSGKEYVAGYGCVGVDAFCIYSAERANNIATFHNDGTIRTPGGMVLDQSGNMYMPWAGCYISDLYYSYVVRNSGNVASVQDSDTYMHVNRHNGGAKGISWWDSDKRLKGNIKDTKEKGLDVINKIEHKSFTKYKEIDKKDIQDNYKIGYIANQLQEIDPQLVFGVTQEEGVDPILNININVLIPYITKSIQELSKENQELKKRIERE